MTLVDLVGALIVLVYLVLGWTSGTIRRVLGLIIVYVAMLAGSSMGAPGGDIYTQWYPGAPPQDARLFGWMFFFLLMLVALEAAALAIHNRLQLAVVALNKTVGVLVGLLTALVVVIGLFYMTAGYGRANVNEASKLQAGTRDALSQSQLVLPLVRFAGPPILPALSGALPRDSQAYFTFR